MNLIILTKFY